MGVPRQGPGLIPGGKRLQSETQKRSQANAPHTVAQPLPTTPLPRRGWEPATHPLLEGPALGEKGFHGRILTCPHPLGPRTSSQSFLGSGLGWRQSRWLSGPRRAVRGALGHTPLSAKASPAFTAKHASAWIRRNRELNRGFGGGTGGGGMSRRHLAKSNGSQAPGMGCGFRATQTQLLWPCPGALSRGVGPKGSGGPDPARVPSISSCRLCPPWRLHASEFLCLALRPGGLDPGTRDGFPPQPLPCAAQPLPPSCIQPPAPFQTCSCLVPLSSFCPGHKRPFLLADGLFQGGHQWSPQSRRHHSVLSSQGSDPPALTSPVSDPMPAGGRLPSAAVSKLNI